VYEWTVAGLVSFRLQGFIKAKLPLTADQLIYCAESQRQRESGGANAAALQEQDTEDLETQGSQSDDDLQFEPQTSGMLTCCTPAVCTSSSLQPWHLLAVTTGLAVNADTSLIASQGFCSCWGQLAHLTKLQSFIRLQQKHLCDRHTSSWPPPL